MTTRVKVAVIGAVVGLALLVLAAGSLFADPPTPTPTRPSSPASGTTLTHEQMDQIMDIMHGEGTSQRMHEAMGPDGEKLMDQCVSMMGMMQNMQGMMGSGMSGTTGGQNGQSMWNMMSRMAGR